jgi:osmoprotectant transport system permease protein
VTESLALLPEYLSAHVRLTLGALLAGVLLAVPAGILVHRVRSLEAPVLALAGVIQTVPALALLAAMVPLLSALGLPGIGPLPAFLALVLYSLLPVLRNTVTGLHGVDPSVVEAARGLGMTRGQRLRQVELPLALPVVVAGVRTATVWTVGMATLSTPVGAPSLGNYIFGGLQTRNAASILTGCAASAVLALALDGLVRLAAAGLATRRRGILAGAVAGLLALAAWAWTPASGPGSGGTGRPVLVGAKTFTEQHILAEVLAGVVRSETGRPVRVLASLGSTVAFDALRRGEIDAYVDYTGTLWATVMGRRGPAPPREEVRDAVRRWLEEEAGVTLAASLGFENAYCFAVPGATAERMSLRTLGDLARHASRLSLASDYEFFAREEWRAVEAAYGLAFRERRTMDPSLLYAAVGTGQVDVITAYSSDGRIDALGLVVLEDERRAIPPYDAVVLAGPRLRREAPDVVAALAGLEGAIDAATMRSLNRLVDEDGLSPGEAARRLRAGALGPTGLPRRY